MEKKYKESHDNTDDIINSTMSDGNVNISIPQYRNEEKCCVRCDTPYKEGEEYCSNCGTRYTSIAQCPNCKMGYDIDDDFCAYCGYTIRKKDYIVTSDNKVIVNIKDVLKYDKAVRRAKLFGLIGTIILIISAILLITPIGKTIFGHFDSYVLSEEELFLGRFTAYVILFGVVGVILVALAISDLIHPPYIEVEVDKDEFERNKDTYNTKSIISSRDKNNVGPSKNFETIVVIFGILFSFFVVMYILSIGKACGFYINDFWNTIDSCTKIGCD